MIGFWLSGISGSKDMAYKQQNDWFICRFIIDFLLFKGHNFWTTNARKSIKSSEDLVYNLVSIESKNLILLLAPRAR